jgi:Mn2+/Fe2+ NRAMP family transporter
MSIYDNVAAGLKLLGRMRKSDLDDVVERSLTGANADEWVAPRAGTEGLVALADPIQERFGVVARWLFLIGFWAAATSSIVGAWNGSAYLFADSVRTSRDVPDERAEEYLSEKSIYFRAMLVWISFPSMLLLFFGEPVLLIIVYAAMGALFLPFLAITLLWLLNSRRVAPEHRNGIVSNIILVASVLLFVFLGIQEILGAA